MPLSALIMDSNMLKMSKNQEAGTAVKRIQMSFLNETRGCIFLKDSAEFEYGSRKYGPFKESDTAEFPNWVLEKLLLHGLVEIAPEEDFESLRNLQNIRQVEEPGSKFQAIHPLLYAAIKRRIELLQTDRSSLDPRLYDEIERLQRMLPTLVETRLTKILRVAKSGAYLDKRKEMTLEERWLCERLVEILSDWRKNLLD
jgi:hypothetical protein